MDWFDLAQDRYGRRAVVNTVMNLRVALNSGNFFNIKCPISFSGRTVLHGVSRLQESVWKSFASYTLRLNTSIRSCNAVQTININNKININNNYNT